LRRDEEEGDKTNQRDDGDGEELGGAWVLKSADEEGGLLGLVADDFVDKEEECGVDDVDDDAGEQE
jgi:hypothetical protein